MLNSEVSSDRAVVSMSLHRFLRTPRVAFVRLTVLALLFVIHSPVSSTGYHPYYYGHGGPYRHYWYGYGSLYGADVSRLRDSLRAERHRLQQQGRQQEARVNQLRSLLNENHRVSAGQACYYRMTGGLEACEDMFAAGSEEHGLCEDKVMLRNPGCSVGKQ